MDDPQAEEMLLTNASIALPAALAADGGGGQGRWRPLLGQLRALGDPAMALAWQACWLLPGG
ncbi:MAG TPA: hypothetical protein VF788_19135 [Pseudonocardiaceae bacterium]